MHNSSIYCEVAFYSDIYIVWPVFVSLTAQLRRAVFALVLSKSTLILSDWRARRSPLWAKTGGGDGSRTHVRNTARPRRYRLILYVYALTMLETTFSHCVSFVIMLSYRTEKPDLTALSG